LTRSQATQPLADRKTKEQLSNLYSVRGIPSLVIVDKDGSTITTDGRNAVSRDSTGSNFPWHPKPVADLEDGPGNLNKAPVVVALCEAAGAAQQAAEDAMAPMAKTYLDEAKAKGEECPELSFMIAKSSEGIPAQLRSMMALPDCNGLESAPPKLVLIDISNDRSFYEGPEGDITKEIVQKFVQDWRQGNLEQKQLKM